jgi:hypothetical protein
MSEMEMKYDLPEDALNEGFGEEGEEGDSEASGFFTDASTEE